MQSGHTLYTRFEYYDELQTLSIEQLCFAVKLWSRRVYTLLHEDYTRRCADNEVESSDCELKLLCKAFDDAITSSIAKVTNMQDPSTVFQQLVELSRVVAYSNFPKRPYANLLFDLYLHYSHGAENMMFEKQYSATQMRYLADAISKTDVSDHLMLTNIGAARFVAENAAFEQVFSRLMQYVELLSQEPSETSNVCKEVTIAAEYLKMYPLMQFISSDSASKDAAATALNHIFTLLKARPNVYVYLYANDINYAYNARGQHLDAYHYSAWAAASCLIRFIATERRHYRDCVFYVWHKDTLLNLQKALLASFSVAKDNADDALNWLLEQIEIVDIPLHRRAGFVPFAFAAIFEAFAQAGKRDAMLKAASRLWKSENLATRWALWPFYREKLFCGSRRMVGNSEYLSCLINCIYAVREDYACRNAHFTLFSSAASQLFTKYHLRLSTLDANQRAVVLFGLRSSVSCYQLLALLFVSYCWPEYSEEMLECVLNIQETSPSIVMYKGRCLAVLQDLPRITRGFCNFVSIIAARRWAHNSFAFVAHRGHGLFLEREVSLLFAQRMAILDWMATFEAKNAWEFKFAKDFRQELERNQ